ETDRCLSEAPINTARVIYAERKDPANGATLYGVLPGAEGLMGSWDAWLTGTDDKTPAAGIAFTWNYLAYMVMNDPKLDMSKVTNADLVRGERTFGPVTDSNDANLSAFKSHGGKLIKYHGWNDPAIPPGYSLEYRERLAAKTRGVKDFYRLYMVPGMLHCGGGAARLGGKGGGSCRSGRNRRQGRDANAAAVRMSNQGTKTIFPVCRLARKSRCAAA